ncbi:hypothetical protein D3C78_428750 [compost metagenome]
MKQWALGLAFPLATLCLPGLASDYSTNTIAQHIAARDQERGLPVDAAHVRQLTEMLDIAAKQCQVDKDSKSSPTIRVADRVMTARDLLAKEGITVSMYDLLDVLKGILGDGQLGWDCSSLLGLYVAARGPEPGMTHISAYKILQGFRDSGLIFAKP